MVDLARGRINWIKNRAMLYWNPDYREETDLVVQQRIRGNNDNVNPQQQQQQRRFTHTTILDERWWIWNILLALSPATVLVLYCEFIGKPNMLDFHKRQALAQIQIAMGNDYTEAKGLAIYNARRELERDPTFGERLNSFLVEMYEIFKIARGWLLDEDEQSSPTSSSTDEDHDHSRDDDHRQPLQKNLFLPVESSPVPTREITSVPSSGSTEPSREPTVAELMQRIQQLETMVSSTINAANMEDKSPETPIKHATEAEINERLRRIQQSGPMSRFEDQFRYKWASVIAAVPPEVLDRVEELEQEKKAQEQQQVKPSIWDLLRGYANNAMAWWTIDDSQPESDTEVPLSTTAEQEQTVLVSEPRMQTPSRTTPPSLLPRGEMPTSATERPLDATTNDSGTNLSTALNTQAVKMSDPNVIVPEVQKSTKAERQTESSAKNQNDDKAEEMQSEEGMVPPTSRKPWYSRFWRSE
jgi:hypothetical protein